MSHPSDCRQEDPRDSKPWGLEDRGTRRGLTPSPTSAGGRSISYLTWRSMQPSPGHLPDPAVLGRAWEGLTLSLHSCISFTGRSEDSGISELRCALMPVLQG